MIDRRLPPPSKPSTWISRRRKRGDRGAVFVEFALVVPILMVFSLGLVEYGLGWKWANDVNAAARDGARSGSSEPAYVTADRSILLAIGTSLTADELDNLVKVVVFKAANADGNAPTVCTNMVNPSGSATNIGFRVGTTGCSVYGKGQIAYVLGHPTEDSWWTNSAGTGCDGSDMGASWCPATRNRSLTNGNFDYLGVYVEVKKPSTTNSGFGELKIKRTAVFQLEPAFGGN